MKRYLYIVLAVLSVAAIAYAADTKFKGNVVVTGSTTTAGITNTGATTNTGAVTFNGAVTGNSTFALNSSISVNNTATLSGPVIGNSTFALNSSISVNNTATLTGPVTMASTVTSNGASTVNGSFKAYSTNVGLGKVNYGTAAGENTITVTLAPAPTAYKTGMFVSFKAYTATASGAATLNVNGLGAKNLKKQNDVDPGARCLEASHVVMAIYDGTNFQLVNPCAN